MENLDDQYTILVYVYYMDNFGILLHKKVIIAANYFQLRGHKVVYCDI